MPLPFILGVAGKAVLGAVVKKSIVNAIKSTDPNIDVGKVVEKLEDNPQFINATNSEPWQKSGVAWGQGVIALGVLVPIIGNLVGLDITSEQVTEIAGAVITIAGILYTLYRRFWPGLPPLGTV